MELKNPKNTYAFINKDVESLKTESSISIMPFRVDKPSGIEDIEKAHSNIRINKIQMRTKKIDEISWIEWRRLYGIVNAIKKDGGDCIAAVQIYFGVDPFTMLMKLIYEPVCLVEFNKSDNINQYKIYAKEKKYVYENNAFISINELGFEHYVTAYTSQMEISQDGLKFEKFKNENSYYGDVKIVLFPFQEIFALHFYNPIRATMLIYNSISKGKDEKRERHSLILAPKDLGSNEKKKSQSSFLVVGPGEYANLAHLCPPKCPGSTTEYYEYQME